jgi:hypothetical protein
MIQYDEVSLLISVERMDLESSFFCFKGVKLDLQ